MVEDSNVQLAANGDMAAFEEIYRTYNRRVYSHCLRMTRSVAEAEDLTQEVFIQLFRKLKTFAVNRYSPPGFTGSQSTQC
jgi:RNA polymerase sigma factor (sigma-70 family)